MNKLERQQRILYDLRQKRKHIKERMDELVILYQADPNEAEAHQKYNDEWVTLWHRVKSINKRIELLIRQGEVGLV